MRSRVTDALVDRLRRFSVLVEVGIGRRTAVAEALANEHECEVRATDVVDRAVPTAVSFSLNDVTDPDPAVYAGADAIYALNLPPELHRPVLAVAREHGAQFAFTTLGGDGPEVPVRIDSLPGETLYWVDGPGTDRRVE